MELAGPWAAEGAAGEFDPERLAHRADGLGASADVDGDGRAETVVFDTWVWGSDALVVATDTDLDGSSDRLSVVADDGRYGVWEFVRDLDGSGRWTRVDEGSLEVGTRHE